MPPLVSKLRSVTVAEDHVITSSASNLLIRDRPEPQPACFVIGAEAFVRIFLCIDV